MEYTVNFLIAPSNKYVGWVVYNNGYFFGSGNNLSSMIRNIRQKLWKTYGRSVGIKMHIASRPTLFDAVPLEKMSDRFKAVSYFKHKTTDRLTKEQRNSWERTRRIPEMPLLDEPTPPIVSIAPIAPKPAEQEFICKEKDGYMVIYQLKEVAKYKMLKGE